MIAKDSSYWAQVHIRSDRAKPVNLPDRIKRKWRGCGSILERGRKVQSDD